MVFFLRVHMVYTEITLAVLVKLSFCVFGLS